jgi:general secretion pathway protein G
MSTPRRRRRRDAFTLIEVLLVLVILAALATMAVTAYGPIQRKYKINQAKGQIGLFSTPLDMYHADMGDYPPALDALVAPPPDAGNSGWAGPYLKSQPPFDPWGRPYNYLPEGRHNPDQYDLWSSGPDGIDGTDDDIGNWE